MAAHIQKALRDLSATISEICAVSGAPGLSYGVLYDGELLHTENFGYGDVEAQTPTTSDTQYYIGSLTKAFTAAAMGSLVDQGKISWDTPIRDALEGGFHFSEAALTQQMTVVDIMSHRMGLQRSNQLWYGNDNTLLLDKSIVIPHIQYLKAVQPFRSTLHYSNWGYALAGSIIEKTSGQSWGNFIEEILLSPLRMSNSSSRSPAHEHDLAKPYTILDDKSYKLLSPVRVQADTIMDASQGLRSTVNDMLKWCRALLDAYSTEQGVDQSKSQGTPLKQVGKQMAKLTPLAEPFASGSFYGMGWVCAQLPTVLGAVGCNPGFVQSMPTVGRGSNERVIYHQGSMAGYTASLFLVPNSSSAIVVLSNSISFNDCADWVGQAILEALLGVPERTDFLKYAQESADTHLAKFPAMKKSLEDNRISGTKPRSLDSYVGKYFNEIGDFFVEISRSQSPEDLQLAFQGLESQRWKLGHYDNDTFTWLMSRNEAVTRARFPYSSEKLYKLEFVSTEDGNIGSLLWAHDADGPSEEFFRAIEGGSSPAATSLNPLAVL